MSARSEVETRACRRRLLLTAVRSAGLNDLDPDDEDLRAAARAYLDAVAGGPQGEAKRPARETWISAAGLRPDRSPSRGSTPSQRQRLFEAICDVAKYPLLEDLTPLERVLDEAQNKPPEGKADGSLTVEEWTAARDFSSTILAARSASRKFWETFASSRSRKAGGGEP